MERTPENNMALVSAVLFLESTPVDESYLAKVTGLDLDDVVLALNQLCTQTSLANLGFEPIKSGGGWVLAPKVEIWEELKNNYSSKGHTRLSKAAMETLSIIAYSQPITRAEVESIRGVSADTMIRFLLSKNLIREAGKKDAPGKPTLYATTDEFLAYFKLNSLDDLPKLEETDLKRFEKHEDEEG